MNDIINKQSIFSLDIFFVDTQHKFRFSMPEISVPCRFAVVNKLADPLIPNHKACKQNRVECPHYEIIAIDLCENIINVTTKLNDKWTLKKNILSSHVRTACDTSDTW